MTFFDVLDRLSFHLLHEKRDLKIKNKEIYSISPAIINVKDFLLRYHKDLKEYIDDYIIDIIKERVEVIRTSISRNGYIMDVKQGFDLYQVRLKDDSMFISKYISFDETTSGIEYEKLEADKLHKLLYLYGNKDSFC